MTQTINPADVVTQFAVTVGEVARHFECLLSFETDCWDVHEALKQGRPEFVLVDVRDSQSYGVAHLPGAVSLPVGKITEKNITQFSSDTLFVVYCTGPHCNGADKAALRLARLGKRVKKMIGGMWGWKDYYGWPVET